VAEGSAARRVSKRPADGLAPLRAWARPAALGWIMTPEGRRMLRACHAAAAAAGGARPGPAVSDCGASL